MSEMKLQGVSLP